VSSDCRRSSAITAALGAERSREIVFPVAAKAFPINSDVKISSTALLRYIFGEHSAADYTLILNLQSGAVLAMTNTDLGLEVIPQRERFKSRDGLIL
jgi:hypothetical protein